MGKAVGHKQLLGVMKLFAVNHSVAHGPWESSSAFDETRGSALELKAVTKLGDALLASRMQGVLVGRDALARGHIHVATIGSRSGMRDAYTEERMYDVSTHRMRRTTTQRFSDIGSC